MDRVTLKKANEISFKIQKCKTITSGFESALKSLITKEETGYWFNAPGTKMRLDDEEVTRINANIMEFVGLVSTRFNQIAQRYETELALL